MPAQPTPARYTVLASGSSGNASLLELNGFGLLVDCGLRPRIIGERLAAAGRSWDDVSAVLLTHTHGDHWNRYTLGQLRALGVPLIAHSNHHTALGRCDEHEPLRRAGLTRTFAPGRPFRLADGLTATAATVPHDCDPTLAFRFEYRDPDTGHGWSLGLASDVGHPTPDLFALFNGVNALAIEFNHDVGMQKASRRPRMLITRVLGKLGHLSNVQAADVAAKVAGSAGPGRFAGLVQLHLSRECNRPEIAHEAGQSALQDHPTADVITTSQHRVAPALELIARPIPAAKPAPIPAPRSVQPCLPGLEAEATLPSDRL